MDSLAVLCAHLSGDFILQTDWMARNKSQRPWLGAKQNAACFIHCAIYTSVMYAACFHWITATGIVACFVAHFAIDRTRFAKKHMEMFGQRDFSNGPLSPWSIVVVDNTMHLLTILLIWGFCRG